MPSDLASHVDGIHAIDTHEHMHKEQVWVEEGPDDVAEALFNNYVRADFVSAGARPEDVDRLIHGNGQSIEDRWKKVEAAWNAIRFTGYARAVSTAARDLFGIEEINATNMVAAQAKLGQLRQPGSRLHILRDLANLDHIQTDDGRWHCEPDESGPGFFFYDISWVRFCDSRIDWEELTAVTGVTVKDISTLRQAMEALFATFAPCAIAVKAQHAYSRTLRWVRRTDDEAEVALQTLLKEGEQADEASRLCLGDWCWARGIEQAIEYDLPFKLHTEYYAGHSRMYVDRIRSGNLCDLLIEYPEARFVLMHIAWPYSEELVAMTKHFPNVWADLCWAWSINPAASMDFVHRFLHGAPINKLFVFGGDTMYPTPAYSYAVQMRRWLTRALEAEVEAGDLTEAEAIEVASRLMRENQLACFDVEGKRSFATQKVAV